MNLVDNKASMFGLAIRILSVCNNNITQLADKILCKKKIIALIDAKGNNSLSQKKINELFIGICLLANQYIWLTARPTRLIVTAASL